MSSNSSTSFSVPDKNVITSQIIWHINEVVLDDIQLVFEGRQNINSIGEGIFTIELYIKPSQIETYRAII